MRRRSGRVLALLSLLVLCTAARPAVAQPLPGVDLTLTPTTEPAGVVSSLRLLLLLTAVSLAPAFLVMMTSFTRIVVVLSFVRSALATQQAPPNQVMIGLALFLTFFTMFPVWQDIQTQAVQPYLAGQLSQEQALQAGSRPLRTFMLHHVREKDLALFVRMAKLGALQTREDIPLQVLVPAFAISELKTAFQMGFLLYVPFLIIDLVVASTLMAMGMFMVPPIMISLPFKILLFVLVDGWYLVAKSLMESFV